MDNLAKNSEEAKNHKCEESISELFNWYADLRRTTGNASKNKDATVPETMDNHVPTSEEAPGGENQKCEKCEETISELFNWYADLRRTTRNAAKYKDAAVPNACVPIGGDDDDDDGDDDFDDDFDKPCCSSKPPACRRAPAKTVNRKVKAKPRLQCKPKIKRKPIRKVSAYIRYLRSFAQKHIGLNKNLIVEMGAKKWSTLTENERRLIDRKVNRIKTKPLNHR